MVEDIKKMPVGAGLPEMPEEIKLAPKKVAIDFKRIIFILLGLGVFILFYLIPGLPDAVDPGGKVFKLPWAGKMALGLFLMAGIWWVFEVMPIGVTAIAIGLFQVLFYIRPAKEALRDFLDPSVWFIFGSVVIGTAFSASGLTKRMAYKMLTIVGERTNLILLGVFLVTAAMTLIMAHTAVAAALFPLLMAINALYSESDQPTKFGKGLFIGMAWAAGAGSIITYLGAARGVAAAGMFKEFTGQDIGFFELIYYMLPIGALMVFVIWLIIITLFKPERAVIAGLREKARNLTKELGPMSNKEKFVIFMVLGIVALFMAKAFLPIKAFKDKIFQGSKDIPLDDLGREEAWAVGKWLKDENIHAVYTSPLSRARDTAIAIARHHNLEVLDLPGLADLSYGDWDGVLLKEVKVKYADLYRQWEAAPHTVCFPNGEPLAVLRTRALGAVEEVVQRHPDQTVLFVAHRVVNKVLIAAFIGLDNSHFWRIAQDNVAINRFHLVEDGRRVGKTWHITSINETGHLRGMMRGAY